jgi:hypothetical protein
LYGQTINAIFVVEIIIAAIKQILAPAGIDAHVTIFIERGMVGI